MEESDGVRSEEKLGKVRCSIYICCAMCNTYNAVCCSMYSPVCSGVCNAECSAVCSIDSVMVGHKGDTLTQPAILQCALCNIHCVHLQCA